MQKPNQPEIPSMISDVFLSFANQNVCIFVCVRSRVHV